MHSDAYGHLKKISETSTIFKIVLSNLGSGGMLLWDSYVQGISFFRDIPLGAYISTDANSARAVAAAAAAAAAAAPAAAE